MTDQPAARRYSGRAPLTGESTGRTRRSVGHGTAVHPRACHQPFIFMIHNCVVEHMDGLLTFAQRWSRFGGGDAEDIMVEFGLTEQAYFSRVLDVLERSDLDEVTREAIEHVARRRLLACGSGDGRAAS